MDRKCCRDVTGERKKGNIRNFVQGLTVQHIKGVQTIRSKFFYIVLIG